MSSRGTTASAVLNQAPIASTNVSPPRGPPDSRTVVMSRFPLTGYVVVPVIDRKGSPSDSPITLKVGPGASFTYGTGSNSATVTKAASDVALTRATRARGPIP